MKCLPFGNLHEIQLHRRLTAEERITEIAKMLSGSRITDAAVAQARILLGK